MEATRRVVADPAGGLAGIDSCLASGGHGVEAEAVLRDWVAANILDESPGIYGYQDLEVRARVDRSIESYREFTGEIPQYAADYTELKNFDRPLWAPI